MRPARRRCALAKMILASPQPRHAWRTMHTLAMRASDDDMHDNALASHGQRFACPRHRPPDAWLRCRWLFYFIHFLQNKCPSMPPRFLPASRASISHHDFGWCLYSFVSTFKAHNDMIDYYAYLTPGLTPARHHHRPRYARRVLDYQQQQVALTPPIQWRYRYYFASYRAAR